MRNRLVGWWWLGVVLLHVLVVWILSTTSLGEQIAFVPSLILSEAIVVVPALILFVVASRNTEQSIRERLSIRGMKLTSVLMLILFSVLVSPLATLANAISLLFVDNEILAMSSEMLEVSFPVLLFMTAINAPICEEFVCRGVIYHETRKSCGARKAVFLSALLFGLMHMNFNQAGYAFVLGIAFALALEATGSIFSAVFLHMLTNATSSIEMYLVESFAPGTIQQAEMLDHSGMEMQIAIGMYFILAAVATPLAGCVIAWIAKNEKREDQMSLIWSPRKSSNGKMLSIPLVLGSILAIAFMVWQQYLIH